MNCPYCNKKMEKGYIEQTHISNPIKWISNTCEDHLFVEKSKIIKLTSILKGITITTYKCDECKKMIIDNYEQNM